MIDLNFKKIIMSMKKWMWMYIKNYLNKIEKKLVLLNVKQYLESEIEKIYKNIWKVKTNKFVELVNLGG